SPPNMEQAVPQPLANLLSRARYCSVCMVVKREGHAHKYRTGHDLRLLTPEEKANLSQRWREEQEIGQEAKKRRLAEDRQEEMRRRREASQTVSQVFRMDFGKHRGLTLDEVDAVDSKYLGIMVQQNAHKARPTLQRALEQSGRLESLLADSKEAAQAAARRVLEKHAEALPTPLAPEVRKLRQIQVAEASEGRKKGKQRQTASRAVVTAPSDADQRKAKDAALEKNRRKARLVARLKYTALHQRSTDYINKSRQRSRATLSRDFLTFARMSPMELALALIEDGLLQNLEGTRCTNPKCGEQKGFGGESILGPLRQGQKNEPNMTRRAVHYRCQCCRKRVTISAGNPLFVGSGAGQHSMSLTILALWNCVEGISITHTVHQLAVDEKVVSWYRTARQIMVWDILRLQDVMIFGKGSETIDVEADESQFQSWSIVNDSSGARTYYWYVWLGVIQRGNPSNFYLESLGVTVSHGEPRVPPLTAAAWRKTCEKVFDEDANVVLMTDSAQAYASVDVPGIVEKHTVNHSEHEFSRSVSVLQNVSTRERRPGMAGTQLVDREWGHLKDLLPHGLSARTEEERARYAEYIREAQWKRVLHTSDRWQRFCVAARDYMQADSRAVVPADPPQDLPRWNDRYFESQEAGRCGMHALNNCLGQQLFAAEDLETVAVAVVEETGEDPSDHIVFQPVSAAAYDAVLGTEQIVGLLVNHDNTHWTCVAKHADALWHVDSLQGQRCIRQPDFERLLQTFPSTFAIARWPEGAERNEA
ncbi:MCM7, partial [Symbiodinium sp. CCMP2592]